MIAINHWLYWGTLVGLFIAGSIWAQQSKPLEIDCINLQLGPPKIDRCQNDEILIYNICNKEGCYGIHRWSDE